MKILNVLINVLLVELVVVNVLLWRAEPGTCFSVGFPPIVSMTGCKSVQ